MCVDRQTQAVPGLEPQSYCRVDVDHVDCLGDNSYGQCGVDPAKGDQSYVGISRVSDSIQHVLNVDVLSLPSFFQVETTSMDPNSQLKVVRVACGAHHTVFQDESGNVYSLGDDSRLQLGLGDTRTDVGYEMDPSSAVSVEWNDSKTNMSSNRETRLDCCLPCRAEFACSICH